MSEVLKAGIALAVCMVAAMGTTGADRVPAQHTTTGQDKRELKQLHDEDQADRARSDLSFREWAEVIGPRDRARRMRVKALFEDGSIRTPNDYYHAAMVLQHGDAPEDFLLAHELCVAAIIKGKNDRPTRWLAASAEDRFLVSIGRNQRFATQFFKEGDGPWALRPVDPAVTVDLRRVMDTGSLEDARRAVVDMNRKP